MVSDTSSAPVIHLNSQLPIGYSSVSALFGNSTRTPRRPDSWLVVVDYLTDVPARHFPPSGQEMIFKIEISHPDTDIQVDTVSLIFKKGHNLKNIFLGTIHTMKYSSQ